MEASSEGMMTEIERLALVMGEAMKATITQDTTGPVLDLTAIIREVLKAMREPTDTMLMSIAEQLSENPGFALAYDAWQAGIDAILDEQP
jgi:hypothetical protein